MSKHFFFNSLGWSIAILRMGRGFHECVGGWAVRESLCREQWLDFWWLRPVSAWELPASKADSQGKLHSGKENATEHTTPRQPSLCPQPSFLLPIKQETSGFLYFSGESDIVSPLKYISYIHSKGETQTRLDLILKSNVTLLTPSSAD